MGKRSASRKSRAAEQPSGPPRQSRPYYFWHFVLLAALCVVVYANSLNGEFVWDDNVQIVRNESIRSLQNIPQMFTSSLWSFAGANNAGTNRYYRPLQTAMFALVYSYAELSPFSYHLANVLLHTAATLILYAFLLELRMFGRASLAPAALFAVHPVHVEAVSWIAGAGELSCGLFYFGALWTFCRYLNRGRGVWLALSAASFFLALLSKEMAVTFPAAAFLVVWMKRADLQLKLRRYVLAALPFALVLVFYGVLRFSATGLGGTSNLTNSGSVLDWVTLGVWVFGQYLRYAFAPYPLTAFHLTSLLLASRILSTVLYALLPAGMVLVLYLRRNTIGLLWMAMFATMLAPVFYFKGITGGFLFSERYLYIPTLAAMAMLTSLGMQLPRKLAVAGAVALVVLFSVASMMQNRFWHDDVALYSHAVAVYPKNTYASANLGGIYLNRGDEVSAQLAFEKGQRSIGDATYMQPADTEYVLELGLGSLAARRNDAGEAKLHLKRALEISPNGENAYTLLAGVLMNLERNAEDAIPLLEKAIELNPVDDQARDSMGVALYNMRRYDEAIARFREALQINPQSELAQQHLERALSRIKN